ncbi:MAG TPA: cbb3-type cytochrome c oxidase subunit I [Planctomycetota bacterium]|nr:cbb3-type cytochrome c oxidase subunit I [Planctomycetota bacterium]
MITQDDVSVPLSKHWRSAAVLVALAGFAVLSFVTVRTYRDAPPIAASFVDAGGTTLFTREDVLRGQEVFLQHALMEHGSLWGHGAYIGPDYSAAYLHRTTEIARDELAREQHGRPYGALDAAQAAGVADAVRTDLQTNRYAPGSDTLVLSAPQAASFAAQKQEWRVYFGGDVAPPGLPAHTIDQPADTDALTAYFAWAAWAATAHRPGEEFSYTNNWPYDPAAGNEPTAAAYFWSAMSLITLLGGLGAVLFVFGRFAFLGWQAATPGGHAHDNRLLAWQPTPSQRASGLFLAVVAVLFLAQGLCGGALAHYRVEPGAFYGFDLARWLPYNLLRTWHLQLAIFWIATAWVAGGLFLAPLMGGGEPRGQRGGALLLLGALAVVVFGSLVGEYLGINDRLGGLWFWFGHQGSEYLDLGRFWQLLLAVGLVLWLFLMFRALRPALRQPGQGDLVPLFLCVAVTIPVFYLPALFYGPHDNFAVIDNWRFWIIHLWVEGFFELFATVLVAVMFFQMGLVTSKTATRVVYLDAILYLGAGVIGTGHHWYFTGQGTLNMALASCFSAMEVVPLTLLTLDAWDFVKLKDRQCDECGSSFAARQKWAIYFLMAVGFWNFVGAGVFGFLINLPIVSYFEIGTTLTTNHGHAALFGVFGMLALGVLVFCLRALADDRAWKRNERLIRTGFWGLNVGLAFMLALDLFPAGVLQLWDSFTHGYWHARELTYTMTGLFHTLEWVRMAADTVFLVVGVVPLVLATLRLVLARRSAGPAAVGPAT